MIRCCFELYCLQLEPATCRRLYVESDHEHNAVLVNIFNCAMDFRSSSSFVIPKKSSQLCTLLLARARARQMASGGFAISISGTTNRSGIKKSRVLKISRYCTIDYPGICTNNPACSLLAILANRQQW